MLGAILLLTRCVPCWSQEAAAYVPDAAGGAFGFGSSLVDDDECLASESRCALHALQRRASVDLIQDASCHNAEQGDTCFESITWAKQHGINEHPDWYPGLAADSSDLEFQALIHMKAQDECPTPCCHDAVQGESCYNDISWAKTQGVFQHPEWYHGLTATSSLEDFQRNVHQQSPGSCQMPCRSSSKLLPVVHKQHAHLPAINVRVLANISGLCPAGNGCPGFRKFLCKEGVAKGKCYIKPIAPLDCESFDTVPCSDDDLLGAGPNAEAETQTLSVMHWNPHWECFVQANDTCGATVRASVDAMLSAGFLDIVNLVMFEVKDYRPPAPYNMIESKCGNDIVRLFYNQERWNITSDTGSKLLCLDGDDRAAVVQSFTSVWGLTITVVGAHFPHPGYGSLQPLQDAVESTGTGKVLMLADTNRDYASHDLLCEFHPSSCNHVISTSLWQSCCKNTGFQNKGFDRVIANFGRNMKTQSHFNTDEPWIGAFHKALVASFVVDLSSNATLGAGPGVEDTSCAAAPACATLRLQGDCCPNANGVRLGCCP